MSYVHIGKYPCCYCGSLKKHILAVDVREITEVDHKVTKRNILSAVHIIFDAIGYRCPVTLAPIYPYRNISKKTYHGTLTTSFYREKM